MALLKFDNERISNSEKQNGKALKNFFKMTISIFGKVLSCFSRAYSTQAVVPCRTFCTRSFSKNKSDRIIEK